MLYGAHSFSLHKHIRCLSASRHHVQWKEKKKDRKKKKKRKGGWRKGGAAAVARDTTFAGRRAAEEVVQSLVRECGGVASWNRIDDIHDS